MEEETKTEEMPMETPATEQTVNMGKDENSIYVGKKGVMGYVLAVVTQFNNGVSEVSIKARGKLISRAVDVAEIVRNRFMPDVNLKSIDIKTEELTSEDGSTAKVSAIDITLAK